MAPEEQGSGSDSPAGAAAGMRREVGLASRPCRAGGRVTLLFTDLVGSTALKQSLGDSAGVALAQEHRVLVRRILKQFPRSP